MPRRPLNSHALRLYHARRPGFENLEDRLMLAADFGDAPPPYPTLLVAYGSQPEAVGPLLGAARDADVDGAPSEQADGDGAEDHGVVFGMVGQAGATLTVSVSRQSPPRRLAPRQTPRMIGR